MFILAGILFLAGLYAFGLAFQLPESMHAIVFALGIVLVGLSMAVPIHAPGGALRSHDD